MWYKLDKDGKTPVPIKGDFPSRFEVTHKTVKQETLDNGFTVSTVFLGLDHSTFSGAIQVFETMVFLDSWSDLDCERYSTWYQAELGHEEMVDKWSKMNPEDYREGF
jgi:hypothetical protein